MTEEKTTAMLDCDFMQYFMRNSDKIDGKDILIRILENMRVVPVIHEYVYNQELFSTPELQELVNAREIKIIQYENFLKDDNDKITYARLFLDLYQAINGERLRVFSEGDIFTLRKAGTNMGEIHSLLTALFCGYHLFLSNDNGSKRISEQYLAPGREIKVYSILDVLQLLSKDVTCDITDKEIKLLTKGDKGRREEIRQICAGWLKAPG